MNETVTTVETTVVEAKAQRGRPVLKDSARQQKLAAIEAKLAAGIEVKRGRPSNPNSERQARLAAREARKAAGYTIAPGRPSKTKADTVSISSMLADLHI
jgi:hypothetical protein